MCHVFAPAQSYLLRRDRKIGWPSFREIESCNAQKVVGMRVCGVRVGDKVVAKHVRKIFNVVM
jgi:hypothetical protein